MSAKRAGAGLALPAAVHAVAVPGQDGRAAAAAGRCLGRSPLSAHSRGATAPPRARLLGAGLVEASPWGCSLGVCSRIRAQVLR